MASKRDLLEAHGYNRRRLVTAFLSGAPGGREVEPVRHGRTVVGGLVLAVLIVAGAAVSGFIDKDAVAKDWAEEGLVIGKDSGSRFFAYKGTLYPVINITSAKLLLAEGSKPTLVPDELIQSQRAGVTIGIPGAPEVLPRPARLIQSGWSACTNGSGGIAVSLTKPPATKIADSQALRVVSGAEQYVIANGHRYPVPAGAAGRLALRALELDSTPPTRVTGLWLSLVPQGSPLRAPDIAGAGQRVRTGVPGLDTVGTPVRVRGLDRYYVLDRSAELVELPAFAAALYSSGRDLIEVDPSDIRSLATDASSTPYPADWPETSVTPYTATEKPCLQLTTAPDQAPEVHLATPATASAVSNGSTVERHVSTGAGAVVRGTNAGVLNAGAVYLIDGSGTSYALGEQGNGEARRPLGYGSVSPRPVPRSWLDLFAVGPELSAKQASRTPGADEPAGSGS